MANISINFILRMLFLYYSNLDITFTNQKLIQKSYITIKVLSTTCQVEITNINKFTKVMIYENVKVFIVHITTLNLETKITISLA